MNWRLLAWGVVACAVLGVGFIVWPPSGPSLEIDIQQRGGKIQLGIRDETLLVGVMLDGPQFGDADAAKLAQVSSLRNVSFDGSSITREGVRRLLPLSGLKSLHLSHTQLVPESLDDVARFTSLQQLRLVGCPWLTDEHLASLIALQSLERLELSSPAITPAGLAQLSQLPALQELTLGVCAAIDDEAVEHLASLAQLKQLTLSGTELTSRGYAELCQRLPSVKVNVPSESLKDLRDVAQRGKFVVDSSGKISSFGQGQNSDGSVKPLLPGHLAVIGTLTGLKRLDLRGEITDKMFLELGPLPQLEFLFLGDTLITDEGLQRLAGFPSLKQLSLYHTPIDGPGLKYLEHMPGLTRLEFVSRQGEDVLQYLAPLQNLDEFVISAPITDEGLERMPVLAKLRSAWFNGSQVLGPGIESLSKQPSLTSLAFAVGPIDDTAIEHIAKLTSLRWVSLGGTRVTEEGRARLRKLCPAMTVVPR
ncbi:MAG: hypothetical protein AABP62_09875 [Planctomycetota bacterium]